jgi:hypothetical protein
MAHSCGVAVPIASRCRERGPFEQSVERCDGHGEERLVDVLEIGRFAGHAGEPSGRPLTFRKGPRRGTGPAVTGFVSSLLSLAVIAAFALAGGGLYLLAKNRDRKPALLMILASAVLLANVLIWALPPPV